MLFLSVKGVISSAVQWMRQGKMEKGNENVQDKDFSSFSQVPWVCFIKKKQKNKPLEFLSYKLSF